MEIMSHLTNNPILDINNLDKFNNDFKLLLIDLEKNKNIAFLKEKILLYRGVSNVEFGFNPSISRMLSELRNLELAQVERRYYLNILNLPFFKEEKINGINISFLARSQHYGYTSRLIDVTFNKLISIYFACNEKLDKNGKIFTVVHKNNNHDKSFSELSEYFYYSDNQKEDKQKHLNRKLMLISENSRGIVNNSNYKSTILKFEGLTSSNEIDKHISEPVAIIEQNEFKNNTISHDMRYESQFGMFILFGNEIIDNIVTNKINYRAIDDSKFEIVRSSDKLSMLIKLSDYGLCFTTIFPDDIFSHKVNRIINNFKILRSSHIDHSLENIFDDYKDIFNINALLRVAKDLINNDKESLFQFILSDLFFLVKNDVNNNSFKDNFRNLSKNDIDENFILQLKSILNLI